MRYESDEPKVTANIIGHADQLQSEEKFPAGGLHSPSMLPALAPTCRAKDSWLQSPGYEAFQVHQLSAYLIAEPFDYQHVYP